MKLKRSSDQAKLISDDAKVIDRLLTIKINQGTKFGTLEKPMFSFFEVISF